VPRKQLYSNTLYGGHTVTHYSRIPASVLFDKRLSVYDKLTFCALSFQCFQGAVSVIGSRMVATSIGISRNKVKKSLQALAEQGHIKKSGQRIRGRNSYELTSPVFGQKQGKQNVMISGPRGRRLVSVEVA
jgi:hypothetical protein